jgi:hypothetical protein
MKTNVQNAIDEIIKSPLGDDVEVYVDDDGSVDISVMESSANKVERILYTHNVDFQKDDDLYPVFNYIIEG